MTLFGVDLDPGYQPQFNFGGASTKALDFAFVHASQGANMVPYKFGTYFKRAEAAFEVVGFYHFLDNSTAGSVQAQHFLNVVHHNGGAKGRLLAVDFENYNQRSPGNSQLANFIHEVKAQTGGHRVICYTTKNFWDGGDPSGYPAHYGIDAMWEAAVWTDTERHAAPEVFYKRRWKPWYLDRNHPRLIFKHVPTPFRQYTWGGEYGGLLVDSDAFEGDMDSLKALTR